MEDFFKLVSGPVRTPLSGAPAGPCKDCDEKKRRLDPPVDFGFLDKGPAPLPWYAYWNDPMPLPPIGVPSNPGPSIKTFVPTSQDDIDDITRRRNAWNAASDTAEEFQRQLENRLKMGWSDNAPTETGPTQADIQASNDARENAYLRWLASQPLIKDSGGHPGTYAPEDPCAPENLLFGKTAMGDWQASLQPDGSFDPQADQNADVNFRNSTPVLKDLWSDLKTLRDFAGNLMATTDIHGLIDEMFSMMVNTIPDMLDPSSYYHKWSGQLAAKALGLDPAEPPSVLDWIEQLIVTFFRGKPKPSLFDIQAFGKMLLDIASCQQKLLRMALLNSLVSDRTPPELCPQDQTKYDQLKKDYEDCKSTQFDNIMNIFPSLTKTVGDIKRLLSDFEHSLGL